METGMTGGPSARRALWIVLIIQSAVVMAITLGVMVAGVGFEQRIVLLFGLLAGLGLAAVSARFLARRMLAPLDQLATHAEAIANRAHTAPPKLDSGAWMLPGAMLSLAESLGRIQSQVQGADGRQPAASAAPVAGGPAALEPEGLKHRIEALTASLPWPCWVTDRNGCITHHNAAAAQLLATNAHDIKGLAIEPWITRQAAPATWSELQRTVLAGSCWRGEVDAQAGDGRTLRLAITAAPTQGPGGEVASVNYWVEDVTEVRQLQNLLIDMERLSTRGKMAGEIAHEINNFLTILGGNLDIIPMLLAAGNHEKVQSKFAAMKQVLDKIARLSDGLMGHRDNDSELSSCDVNRLIENLVAFLKPQNRYDEIEVSCRPDPALPKISVRVGQIQQVLVNLLNNAADAVHSSRDREGRIDIETRHLPDRGEISISVRDNGPGLSRAASARIFRERYSDKKSGHGLGLLNCHRIAQAHRGTLTVESSEGQGTAFTFTLPTSQGQALQPTSARAVPAAG
jgi:signal transduction histidine kinase